MTQMALQLHFSSVACISIYSPTCKFNFRVSFRFAGEYVRSTLGPSVQDPPARLRDQHALNLIISVKFSIPSIQHMIVASNMHSLAASELRVRVRGS